jgi:predicted nuclease of predicted toxin-antitoxin system
MKLLLDACVWGSAAEVVRAAGHDVVWAGEWPEDPGDDEILIIARQQQRVVVTLDKDFGELATVRGYLHCGIIRLVNQAATRQAAVCLRVLERYEADLRRGAIVTVEPGRVRVRPPDAPNIGRLS